MLKLKRMQQPTTRREKWGGEEGQYEVGRSKKRNRDEQQNSKTKVRRLIYRMMRPCLTWATVTIGQGDGGWY